MRDLEIDCLHLCSKKFGIRLPITRFNISGSIIEIDVYFQ